MELDFPLRTFKLLIEYDGTEFFGWQTQPGFRTVQGEIEKALFTLTGEKIRVTGGGRTDTGVHALGQTASFSCRSRFNAPVFYRALNGLLPKDVRIRSVEETDLRFNARKDAVSRTYRYVIAKREKAIGRRYAWYPRFQWDLDPMKKASEFLLGKHSWKAFSKVEEPEKKYESAVFHVRWVESPDEVFFEITAERFFRHMVRCIVGTLLEVGRHCLAPEQFREILETEDRKKVGPVVPPWGLFLVSVNYEKK